MKYTDLICKRRSVRTFDGHAARRMSLKETAMRKGVGADRSHAEKD